MRSRRWTDPTHRWPPWSSPATGWACCVISADASTSVPGRPGASPGRTMPAAHRARWRCRRTGISWPGPGAGRMAGTVSTCGRRPPGVRCLRCPVTRPRWRSRCRPRRAASPCSTRTPRFDCRVLATAATSRRLQSRGPTAPTKACSHSTRTGNASPGAAPTDGCTSWMPPRSAC